MANHLSNRLNRLVRKRAYQSGEAARTQAEIDRAKALVKKLQSRKARILKSIAQTDAQIEYNSGLEVAEIRPIRYTPHQNGQRRGSLINTIIEVLQAESRPVLTVELVDALAPVFGWHKKTPEAVVKGLWAVRRPLNILKKKGVVERLPSHLLPSGIACGVWRWIGPPDANNPTAQ